MPADSAPRRVLVVVVGDGDRDRTSASVESQRGVAAAIVDPPEAMTGREHDPSAVLVLVNAGATFAAGALARLAEIMDRFEPELIYADSTVGAGSARTVVRRPDFSPLRLLTDDYLGELVTVGPGAGDSLARILGGDRTALAAVALDAGSRRVVHIAEPLLHRETAPVRPGAGQRRAFAVMGTPLVSIIIPTRGSSAVIRGVERVLIVDAVRSIVETSSYADFEIVVVADDATPPSVVDELDLIAGDRLKLVRWSGPFNFSGKINRGAAHASGEHLLLLNDDVEVISPDWIQTMLALSQQPGIGLVGANLFFEDGTRQHAGHFYRDGLVGHIAIGWAADDDDWLGSLTTEHEVAGATAACAMVSRSVFDRVGGFSSLLPGNYNDVDFSLKVRSIGERIVWTPWARLFHFESKTRTSTSTVPEFERLRSRWGSRIEVDPYWSDLTVPFTRH